ncbi:MAG TPA: hypothetical protein VFA94_05640 [Acidimicrobiales bacterium]|nr:hypothetical protein [Acidimicrobiales bacterium]
MRIAEYAPAVFDGLPQFSTAKRRLHDGAVDDVGMLGDVIVRHGLHLEVGVCLLHQHFPLDGDERLVKRMGDNRATVRPHRAATTGTVAPYNWTFVTTHSGPTMVPLEFVEQAPTTASAARLAATALASVEFLDEFEATLRDLSLIDLFGLTTLHHDGYTFRLGDILLETTDHDARVLTLEPSPADDYPAEDVTETVWAFSPKADARPDDTSTEGDPQIICVTCPEPPAPKCGSHCYSHCVGHCVSHPPQNA